MWQAYNGMSSEELRDVRWCKSGRSSAQGNCVEVAKLPGGEVAMRNSRHPEGPALVFTSGEFEAFVLSAKDGDFNGLLQ
jgi:Domain of unknown function (DUF397)